MEIGDTVRVRHQGRTYLAQVTETTSRTAHIKFLSQVPALDCRKKRERAFSLKRFREYGKAGIDYTLSETT